MHFIYFYDPLILINYVQAIINLELNISSKYKTKIYIIITSRNQFCIPKPTTSETHTHMHVNH